MTHSSSLLRPSGAFVGASWASLAIGVVAYLVGLWNGPMALNEKGFYLAVLLLGLFAAISLQKTVRDKMEGLPVTGIYMGVCWAGMASSLLLLAVGLFNASLDLSIKGFYAMAYLLSLFAVVTVQKNVLSLFAVVTVQKNVRDLSLFPAEQKDGSELENA